MNWSISTIFSLNGLINMVLLIGLAVGGIIATRGGYMKKTMDSQKETIEAFQSQITALTAEVAKLTTKITTLEHVQETIVEALAKKKMKVTIDGDMVTIIDPRGDSSSMKRRTAKNIPATIQAHTKTTTTTVT